MRWLSFASALGEIGGYEGPRQNEVLSLFDRIMALPGDQWSWSSSYDLLQDVYLEFYPWQLISDPESLPTQDFPPGCGIAYALVKAAPILSSPSWFDQPADHWLRVVAADLLSERLKTRSLLQRIANESPEEKRNELIAYLPGLLDNGIADARGLLLAADAVSAQRTIISTEQSNKAKRAAKVKNDKFVKLQNKFFDFYLANCAAGTSRRELARRFVSQEIKLCGSERALPYQTAETAQRSLLDYLRKQLADTTGAEQL